jgi:hypothetical protein
MSLIHVSLLLVLAVVVWCNGYLTKTLNTIISAPINVSLLLLLCITIIDSHLVGLSMLEKPGQIAEQIQKYTNLPIPASKWPRERQICGGPSLLPQMGE